VLRKQTEETENPIDSDGGIVSALPVEGRPWEPTARHANYTCYTSREAQVRRSLFTHNVPTGRPGCYRLRYSSTSSTPMVIF
jgi:hypothetical protein